MASVPLPANAVKYCQTTRSYSPPLGRAERGEENDVANRRLIGEEHHHAVDPHAQATRRWHAMHQRGHEILVHRHRIGVTLHPLLRLLLESCQLIERIIQ